jgi:uncharacterized membrane protein
MSTEAEEIKIDLTVEEGDTITEPSEIEIEAASHGWTPGGVEGKKNLTAEEFMDRQPLYDEIRSTKKQIKKLQEGVDALKSHQATIRSDEREKVIKELKVAKRQAMEDENYDAVIEIDDKIATQRAEAQAAVLDPVSNGAFESWESQNEWYNQDDEMKEYADMVGNGLAATHPNIPLTDVYERVTKEVKKRFASKFTNPASATGSPVEGGKRGTRTSSKLRVSDLPEQDRRIMESIIKAGGITKEEYLEEYSQLGS